MAEPMLIWAGAASHVVFVWLTEEEHHRRHAMHGCIAGWWSWLCITLV